MNQSRQRHPNQEFDPAKQSAKEPKPLTNLQFWLFAVFVMACVLALGILGALASAGGPDALH